MEKETKESEDRFYEEFTPLSPQQALIYHTEEIRGIMKGKGVDKEISKFYFKMWELLK